MMAFSVRLLFCSCPRVPIRRFFSIFCQPGNSRRLLTSDFNTHRKRETYLLTQLFGIEESITKPSVLNFHLTMCLFTCVSIAWAERNVDTSKIHFIVAIVVIVDSKPAHKVLPHIWELSKHSVCGWISEYFPVLKVYSIIFSC